MKIIKLTEDHYIVMDDSEIKEGDWIGFPNLKKFVPVQYFGGDLTGGEKKITHSTQPLGWLNEYGFTTANLKPDWTNVEFLPLSEVKELLGVVDVEKSMWYERNLQNPYPLDSPSNTVFKKGFELGYNQALEDNKYRKYTNEDMLTIRNQLVAFLLIGDVTALDKIQAISKYTKWFDECVESLQPTEWEVEFVNDKLKLK